MHHNKSSYTGITAGTLMLLWRNWLIAFGALVLPVVVGMFIPRTITPIIVLLLATVLVMLERSSLEAPAHGCTLVIRLVSNALFVAGVLMVVVNVLKSEHYYAWWFNGIGMNPNMPFISGMLIFPVTALLGACKMIGFRRRYLKREHRGMKGHVFVGDSTLGTYLYREARYQLLLLTALSATLAVVNGWYWTFYYIDINFNSPDYFFFLVLPVATFIVSLVFVRLRYAQVIVLLQTFEVDRLVDNDTTILRFMVLAGDKLLLRSNTMKKWDTPYEIELRHSPHRTSADEVRHLIGDALGIKEFDVRYIYTNTSGGMGLRFEHYAVFLPVDLDSNVKAEYPKLEGEWFTLDLIERNLRAGELSPMLMNEVYRIFTITMAWKTYDRYGNRLYPIKNYRPTFRLRDLREWEVDYDDTSWLHVANDNEDHRLFRLRKTWRNLFHLKP